MYDERILGYDNCIEILGYSWEYAGISYLELLGGSVRIDVWSLEILGYSCDLTGCSNGMVFHYLPRFSMHDLQRMVEFRLVYGEVSKSMCRLCATAVFC